MMGDQEYLGVNTSSFFANSLIKPFTKTGLGENHMGSPLCNLSFSYFYLWLTLSS